MTSSRDRAGGADAGGNAASTHVRSLLGELRPRLHRYCARMTGSVIDGEDVVQEAVVKALEALERSGAPDNPEGWAFRIAHNAAIDFLRRRMRQEARHSDQDPDMTSDPASDADSAVTAAASLRTFMQLPVLARSSVILKDVLGYSLEEIGDVTGSSIPAVKAALHRGRTRLRELADELPEPVAPPPLSSDERRRLAAYVERFNARDFDAVRDMLGADVRLELVGRTRMSGKQEVSTYFSNYDRVDDWRLVPGFVEGRPAVIVVDPQANVPRYFVLLDWDASRLAGIRDFRYARYAIEGAELTYFEPENRAA